MLSRTSSPGPISSQREPPCPCAKLTQTLRHGEGRWQAIPPWSQRPPGERVGGDGYGGHLFFCAHAPKTACSEHRVYIEVETTCQFAQRGVPLPRSDVHLPHRWPLNQMRVSVPTILTRDAARRREIMRSRGFLLPDLQQGPAYVVASPLWATMFGAEHGAQR
jgi:hypothetical protein